MSPRNERSTLLEFEGVTRWLSRSLALSRLRLALGCCWATVVINHDCARIPVPAANPVVAMRGYLTPGDGSFGYFSLRSGTLFLILGLHAALFCGLTTALSHTQGLTPTKVQIQVLNPLPLGIETTAFSPRQ
jgi:hypothetical protein